VILSPGSRPGWRVEGQAYNAAVGQRQCYHCKQWIAEDEPHDCWTTTEAALTRDLAPDLLEAWERLRETASEFGVQRIYASHSSIMFSRRSCYFFVRPKRTFLEVCVFLGRTVSGPEIRRVEKSSATKFVHFVRITHRDQVEAPITDWLREAYEYAERPPATHGAARTSSPRSAARAPRGAAPVAKRVRKRAVTAKKSKR